MPRSVYSDPIASAVDTGTKLLGAIDSYQANQQNRQIKEKCGSR